MKSVNAMLRAFIERIREEAEEVPKSDEYVAMSSPTPEPAGKVMRFLPKNEALVVVECEETTTGYVLFMRKATLEEATASDVMQT